MNKSFTKAANDYAIRRIKNGYWKKVDKYNDVLKKCKITKLDYKNVFKKIKGKTKINKFYVEPPYHGIKNLYKNSFNDNDHKILNSFLNNIKINNPKCKILISYNDTSLIRNLYKDWYIQEEEFQYQTGKLNRSEKKKKVNELFITNFKN
jgi:DNA adenine methylase